MAEDGGRAGVVDDGSQGFESALGDDFLPRDAFVFNRFEAPNPPLNIHSNDAVTRISAISSLLLNYKTALSIKPVLRDPGRTQTFFEDLVNKATSDGRPAVDASLLVQLAPHADAVFAVENLAVLLSDQAETLNEAQYKSLFDIRNKHLEGFGKLLMVSRSGLSQAAQRDLGMIEDIIQAGAEEIQNLIQINPDLAEKLSGGTLEVDDAEVLELPALARTDELDITPLPHKYGPPPEEKKPGFFVRHWKFSLISSLIAVTTAVTFLLPWGNHNDAVKDGAREGVEIAEQIAARDAFNAAAAASRELSDDPALAAKNGLDGASATMLVGTLEQDPTLPEPRGADLTEVCSETAPCAVAGGRFNESLYEPLVRSAQPAISGETPTSVAVAALELDPDAVRDLGLKMWAERLAFQRPDFVAEPVSEEIPPVISSAPAVLATINAQDSGPVGSSLPEGFGGIRVAAVSPVAPGFASVPEAAKGAAGNIGIAAAAGLETPKEAVGLPKAPSALGVSNAPSFLVALGAPGIGAAPAVSAAAFGSVVIAPAFAPAPTPRPAAPEAAPVVATIAPAALDAAAVSTPPSAAPATDGPAARAYAGDTLVAPEAGAGVAARVAFNDNVAPPAPVAEFVSHNRAYVPSKGAPRSAVEPVSQDEIAALYFKSPAAEAKLAGMVEALTFESSPAPVAAEAPAAKAPANVRSGQHHPKPGTFSRIANDFKQAVVSVEVTAKGLNDAVRRLAEMTGQKLTDTQVANWARAIAKTKGLANPDVVQQGMTIEAGTVAFSPAPQARPDVDEMAQAYAAYYR